jgi:hypothetical protein
VSWKQEPPDRNRCSSLAHTHAVTRPPPDVIRFSCACVCDVTDVTSRKSCTIVTASTAAQAPKRLGFGMPAPRETLWSSAAQLSRRFPKNSFSTPPSSKVESGGCARTRGKTCFRKPRRQLHPAVSDLPRSRLRARSASPPPKYTLGPHACASGATQAMLMAGRARERAHRDPHR